MYFPTISSFTLDIWEILREFFLYAHDFPILINRNKSFIFSMSESAGSNLRTLDMAFHLS